MDYIEPEKLRALRDAAKNAGGLAGAGLELSKSLISKKEELTSPDSYGQCYYPTKKVKTVIR